MRATARAGWYVLRSKPRRERALQQYARQQGHEVFLPTIPVRPVNPRAARIAPFFPGYLFVHADLRAVGDTAFEWMPLSQGLVRVGSEPAAVPEAVVKALAERVERIWRAGGLADGALEHGEAVRLCGGVFDGYEGVFDARLSGAERVRVLLRLLHDRCVAVDVHRSQVERQGAVRRGALGGEAAAG